MSGTRARLTNIEELMTVIYGGGLDAGNGPGIPDPAAKTRAESLVRLMKRRRGSPQTPLQTIEADLMEVDAELTRLRAHKAELNIRLKKLRGDKSQ